MSTKSAFYKFHGGGGSCSLVAPPLDVPVMIIITIIRLFVYQFIVCCTARCFATNVVVADYKNFGISVLVIIGHIHLRTYFQKFCHRNQRAEFILWFLLCLYLSVEPG
jgi:hypothetical protein